MERLHLSIDGMSCGHCVARVDKALRALSGVKVARVDVGSAIVEFDPALVSVERVTAALDDAGYPARSTRSAA
jgi:copper chaperone